MQPSGVAACPKCDRKVDSTWRLCPECGAALHPARDGAARPVLTGAPSASSVEEGRSPAGSVVAGRYRVLGLIGGGGMGELSRAYDVILNQPVALKFLGRAGMSDNAL